MTDAQLTTIDNPSPISYLPSPEPQALSGPDASANTGNTVRASWPYSLHDIRANLSHCDHDSRETMISLYLWCIDPRHPVTRQEFSAESGFDHTTVQRIYQGKYIKHPTGERLDIPPKLVTAAKTFLARQRHAYKGRSEFITTPTSKRIHTACELARESRTTVWVLGPSHIGKTWALEYYSQEENHGRSPYVRMKAASGLGGMVRRIAERVGVSPAANTADLIDRIKRALSPETLLILDELHLLAYTYRRESFFSCLEVIREIHDEVGCGMVLCGTQLLRAKITAGQHGEMEQLVRRGVHKIILPSAPTRADLTAILAAHGLDFPDRRLSVALKGIVESPYEILRQLAKTEGLKSITERIRYASRIGNRESSLPTWEHFVRAHLAIAAGQAPADDWS